MRLNSIVGKQYMSFKTWNDDKSRQRYNYEGAKLIKGGLKWAPYSGFYM